jgi:RNase H-fold protein (predicted Holliday junction resolvase)
MSKIIGVLTRDFSLYYDLIETLNRKAIPFVSCSFNKNIPSEVGVLLTSKQEAEQIKFDKIIRVEDFLSIDSAIDSAFQAIRRRKLEEILVGVDPGDTLGIAIFSEGSLLDKMALPSSNRTIDELRKIIENYKAKRVIVKIGNGAKYQRNFLIKRLKRANWLIELVDERNTTTLKAHREKDMDAAVLIALKQGKPIEGLFSARAKPGELQFIQERSRIKSKNSITISKELAERVFLGEISLEEAIEKQRSKHRSSLGRIRKV